jgi:HEAT repeats
MRKIAVALSSLLILISIGGHSWAADSAPKVDDLTLIKQLIEQIRSESDSIARERAAATLARTLQRVNRSSIGQTMIDQTIDLLHDDSDRVRSRIAMAIAAIGPPAKRAAPALEEALELAKQYMLFIQRRNLMYGGFEIFTGTSSADAICMAFKAIGPPSPPDCFDGWFGEPVIEVPWTKGSR